MMERTGQSIGTYRLGAPLGDEGGATFYRTTDPTTGQPLVLVLLHSARDEAGGGRFLAMLPALAALAGPHIVPILDWGIADGSPYLTMPALQGGTLRRLLGARVGLHPARMAGELLRQAAEGVGYAHQRGIVHGDLRPERLLLDESAPERGAGVGWLRVALFGLAGPGGARGASAETNPYRAPEAARGAATTARGDVYALGAILYEALAGRAYEPGAGALSQIEGGAIPPPLVPILRRCLDPDPAGRYDTATPLAAALRAALAALSAEHGAERASPGTGGIGLTLIPTGVLTLTPGESAMLRIDLTNTGQAPARLALTLDGAPRGWVGGVPEVIALAPGATETIALTVAAPRDAHEPAGEYPVMIRVRAREGPAGEAMAATIWTLLPFAAGVLTLSAPERAGGDQHAQLHNRGNASLRHTLAVAAAAPLTATITSAILDLDPDETGSATVRLAAPRHWLGRTRRYPFAVEARAAGAAPLRAEGRFTQPARIPLWALPVVILAFVAVALGGAVVAYPQNAAFLGLSAPRPTTIAALVAAATATTPPRTPAAPAIAAAGGTPHASATSGGGEPLLLSVNRLDFGRVPLGGNGVQTLQVKNISDHPVTFRSIQISGDGAAEFVRAGPCGLEALDTGFSCPLTIIFTPSGLGDRDARLEITPVGGNKQTVLLTGNTTAAPIGTPQIAPPSQSPPPLAGARSGQAAALLADGRRLLVAGGRNGQNVLKSAEVYDLTTNAWTSTRDMSVARVGHSATALPDGTVLALGGRNSTTVLKSAEVYDPATQSWSPFPQLTTEREGHTATVLADGRSRGYQILVLGGTDQRGTVLASGEIYDSTTRSWTELAQLIPGGRARHTATLLPTAAGETPRILVVGGVTQGGEAAPAQLFDPSGGGSWRAVGGEPAGLLERTDFTATRVEASGEIVFIGGGTGRGESGAVVIYDPASQGWRELVAGLATGRAGQTATLLPYGRILIVGGKQGGRETASVLLLDPAQFDGTPAPSPTPAPDGTPEASR